MGPRGKIIESGNVFVNEMVDEAEWKNLAFVRVT
jgi:hypothetical protein